MEIPKRIYPKQPDQKEEIKPNSEKLSELNVRTYFKGSANSNIVSFANGKVLLKCYTSFDEIGYAFTIIGMVVMVVVARNDNNSLGYTLTGLVIGLILCGLGKLLNYLIKSYSVIDYRNRCIYKELLLNSFSIWKYKKINFSDIAEIAIDNRPTEAATHYKAKLTGTPTLIQGNKKVIIINKFESAVTLLLKKGKLHYITDFTIEKNLADTYIIFSQELAKALKIKYKMNFNNFKLIVKKLGQNYYLDSENNETITVAKIILSFCRIVFGVAFIGIAILLMFRIMYILLNNL